MTKYIAQVQLSDRQGKVFARPGERVSAAVALRKDDAGRPWLIDQGLIRAVESADADKEGD